MWNLNRLAAAMILTCVFTVSFCSAGAVGCETKAAKLVHHEGFVGTEEFPQHSVCLPTYQIGKYEVTRGQYRRFIEAGGYDDPNYWSPEGWKWKESDIIVYAGMHGKFRHTIRPNKETKRNQPEHWEPEQEWIGHGYNHPIFIQTDDHPVVGVTYYEAEAYCRWAGGRLQPFPIPLQDGTRCACPQVVCLVENQ